MFDHHLTVIISTGDTCRYTCTCTGYLYMFDHHLTVIISTGACIIHAGIHVHVHYQLMNLLSLRSDTAL